MIQIGTKKLQKILTECKEILIELYKEELSDIILYGSYARGEQRDDSDIDLAVILKADINPYNEIDKIVDSTYHLNLKFGIVLSIHPISEKNYKTQNLSFFEAIKEEGISLCRP